MQELLLVVAAPVLALIILVIWLTIQARRNGPTNLHLKFLGLSLDVRACNLSERQCRKALGEIDR